MKFTKMHGAGNDYIYVDTMKYDIPEPGIIAREWSRPHTGIGSDGLVLIGRSDIADFSMYEKGLASGREIRLETLSGIKTLYPDVSEDGTVGSVCVDMGPASDIKELRIGGKFPHEGISLSMGNPHYVIFTEDAEKTDLEAEGPEIEHNPAFLDRVNVEFAEIRKDGKIRVRVWERGSGITKACGTGACATAVAAAYTGRAGNDTWIEMDGGLLRIRITPERHILMTGPAVTVFEGEIEYEI